ncbi:BREX-1 system adenine-specific DNA-methyltransferase PglX [Galactobacillus timonensis]|uniref:BREX-1 system adenine-specific DNA-methyltransferase PglX n=1 Tax=Galactobacillus timonensis TaxID=2041840 RepID=UPI000C867364|nr:BREX-1 system adenine-specific DNA-methyltransferase PglX [Galactobacillus timonensis]
MNKSAIKNFAVWARNRLMNDVKTITGMYGITEKGISDPLPASTSQIQYFDIGTKQPVSLTGEDITSRKNIANSLKQAAEKSDYSTAYNLLIETTASSWFNRLAAIRYMEVNDYFDDGLRMLSSSEEGLVDPDIVATPFNSDLEFTDEERQQVIAWKNNNQNNELFRFLLLKRCNRLSQSMPGLFEKKNDSSEFLLRPSYIDQDGVIYHLTHDIDEDDWKDQVQIIGWLYQYYNAELKDDTFKQLKKNNKISKERIPSATQLFTPDWIVRYMVENSLGRIYINHRIIDGVYADGLGLDEMTDDEISENRISSEKVIADQFGWKYFIPEAHQSRIIEEQFDNEWRAEKLEPEDLTFIDPSMGSGHILVYAFDVLMRIYQSYGYTDRDAVRSILTYNLYGLDIDERAYQLAYFAVLMKARQYDRRILSRGIVPHVYAIEESNDINYAHLKYIGNKLPDSERKNGIAELERLLDDFRDAKIYGSIIKVQNYNFDSLRKLLDATDSGIGSTVKEETIGIEDNIAKIRRIIDIAEVMQRRYMVTVTNPPYMGGSNMNAKLSAYVKNNYPDSKSDLFSVFMEVCSRQIKQNGLYAMITQQSWMFLSSFEKLREKITGNTTVNMVHLGARAFDDIGGEVVQTTTFVNYGKRYPNYKGAYIRLVDFNGEELQRQKTLEAISNHNCGYYYETCSDNFAKVPGMPVAYWISKKILDSFTKGTKIGDIVEVVTGMSTGNNDEYLRVWSEVSFNRIALYKSDMSSIDLSTTPWIPYNKGGEARKWYGNNNHIVKWSESSHFHRARPTFSHLYLMAGITWSFVTSGMFSARYYPNGFLWDVAGSPCVINDRDTMLYVLGYLSTNIANQILKIINPTLNCQVIDIQRTPILLKKEVEKNVDSISNFCIRISRAEWDSFETSWDFKRHPLLPRLATGSEAVFIDKGNIFGSLTYSSNRISDAFKYWKEECDNRFNQLKSNEEELNRIFIDIYGLQDELTPEEDDSDVTVRKADLTRDIKSLISYAVGCMFGRYSLDEDGLVYAGGTFDMNRYHIFIPDNDNVLPITDEKYLDDDIVHRFCDWTSVVYGKETLEENLDYIAKALGDKEGTSRECIRNYFLNEFFKDHCSTYSVTGSGKRPIYWLFDSGKQNAFKALVYMHRWDENTIGRVRLYTHEIQSKYETEMKTVEADINQSTDNRQIARDEKRLDHLKKQVVEIKEYDEKLEHLAAEHITIDLDDGVKVNYEKVQTDRNGKKYQILAPIK